jgi:hypothetical protein
MSNDSQQIVSKAWNFAHVLWDDGLSYLAYTECSSAPPRNTARRISD